MWETWVRSLGQEDPLEKEMANTPVLLPGKSHGWRSLVGYNPWGHKESDMMEWLHLTSLHFPHCGQKIFLESFNFFEFNKARFMAQDVIYPGDGSMCTWLKGEIHCFGVKYPIDIIRPNWSTVSFKVCVYLLILCLVDLSIVVSGVLKSPTIIVLLLISSFILVSVCHTYCGAPMLGAYISGHYCIFVSWYVK